LTISSRNFSSKVVLWYSKPWIIPAAAFRTVTIVVFSLIFLFLEMWAGVAFPILFGLPVYLWTVFAFTFIWIISMFELLLFYASHSYTLRQDGLEVRRGLIRLHSFVVTPSGFGDLQVYQSLGGRIFGYGDVTVNSQGERQTKLALVRAPFLTAESIRDVMGKPIVRVESQTI
jgi:hypothetical protein